jgi:hypothetical protein
VNQVQTLKRRLWEAEKAVETLKTTLAQAIWDEFEAHPAERVTLPRVAYFYLERMGEAKTEEIVEFLTRIKWPTSSRDLVNTLGVQMKARPDLFVYDRKRRVWSRKSG